MLVKIDSGTIRGKIDTNILTSEGYYSFKGVPYAQPPTGPLRFQPPQPAEKFEDVLDCFDERGICIQRDMKQKKNIGSEDCLYLNIFTPQSAIEGGSRRPVMVFIHGGSFSTGSKNTSTLGPDFLVSKGIVLVTLNYRLSIFGFLNLGIEECKGNMGLLDQRAALIWVKNNIHKFNGDPNNITLFGSSAGAGSVYLHIISPLSKGLFQKAILQSGSGFANWCIMDPDLSLKTAFTIGKKLGFETEDAKKLFDFLRNAPAEDLLNETLEIQLKIKAQFKIIMPFVPSIETAGPLNERFLLETPKVLSSEALEVSVMCGLNSGEGILLTQLYDPEKFEDLIQCAEAQVENNLPYYVRKLYEDPTQLKSVIDKVKEFYFGDGSLDKIARANKYLEFFSDTNFGMGHYIMVKKHCSLGSTKPLYSYLLSQEQPSKTGKPFKGVNHGGDLPFLFCSDSVKNEIAKTSTNPEGILTGSADGGSLKTSLESNRNMIDKITSLWTNFAKYGDPNGDLNLEWKPVTIDEPSYCEINEEMKIHNGFPFKERMIFWDKILY